ncbi:MAG: CPBP family intramembrane metalloprotease [Planctomycetia bacterium]|nr:CPBP family intramembrane metalloprotease [Planctomycetia bacterium]
MHSPDQPVPPPHEPITARPADFGPDEPLPTVQPFRSRRWRTVLAWLVILTIVAGIFVQVALARRSAGNTTLRNIQDQSEDFTFRYLVGTYQLLRGFDPSADERIYQDSKQAVAAGTPTQQIRFAIFAGELKGPTQALAELAEIKAEPVARLVSILRRLYGDYERQQFDAPSVTDVERTELRTQLGWMGELALNPEGGPDPARRDTLLSGALRTCFTLIGALVIFGGLGLVGFVVLLVVVLLAWYGRLKSGIGPPSGTGGLYAETFALWLLLFVGLSQLFRFPLLDNLPDATKGLGMLLTLVVLAWPVAWGVPWRQVRAEIGLTWGRRPWAEPLLGIFTYIMSLPLLAVGLLIVLALMKIQGWVQGTDASPPPSHPIAENLGQAGWWQLLQLLFLASVVAPVVEEIMFRGILYRHLREATGAWRAAASMLTSATVVGFLFAVVHPQGWLGVPVLMAIAYGLNISREWRGTLIPAMVGHGLNNFIMLVLTTFLFRG